MLKRPRRDPDIDFAGCVEQEEAPQESESSVEQEGDTDPDGDDLQCLHCVVHEDLVDHDLKVKWNHESDQMDEQRGDGDIAKRGSLTEDFGDEPLQAEWLVAVE